jgi:hypothetical protein
LVISTFFIDEISKIGRHTLRFPSTSSLTAGVSMADAETQLFTAQVGVAGDAAKTALETALTGVTVHVLDEGSMVTMDYRTDRVRIFVDPVSKLVTKAPRRG